MKYPYNPDHKVATCPDCGGEMIYNVPRFGLGRRFVHKSNRKWSCPQVNPSTSCQAGLKPMTFKEVLLCTVVISVIVLMFLTAAGMVVQAWCGWIRFWMH